MVLVESRVAADIIVILEAGSKLLDMVAIVVAIDKVVLILRLLVVVSIEIADSITDRVSCRFTVNIVSIDPFPAISTISST